MGTKHKSHIYSIEQKETAKELYMQYRPFLEIAAETGLSIYAINWYARKYWRQERDLAKTQVIQLLGEQKAKAFAEIGMHGMDLLVRSLREHSKNGTILSVKEAFALSNIITNIDKIVRLDEGAPTDIISDMKPSTREEVIEVINVDPFFKRLPGGKE